MALEKRANGWRARRKKDGKTFNGPLRATEEAAHEDARQMEEAAAVSSERLQEVLDRLLEALSVPVVQKLANGWRARRKKDGQTFNGPLRATEVAANEDARQMEEAAAVSIVLPGMDARDSARDNAMYEAENDQLIGKLIELERATSALRLVQTLLVLLERLIPLLEEIRAVSRNSLAVIAMLKDNLLTVEADLQQRSCEVREQILARYHRALRGWREQWSEFVFGRIDVVRRTSRAHCWLTVGRHAWGRPANLLSALISWLTQCGKTWEWRRPPHLLLAAGPMVDSMWEDWSRHGYIKNVRDMSAFCPTVGRSATDLVKILITGKRWHSCGNLNFILSVFVALATSSIYIAVLLRPGTFPFWYRHRACDLRAGAVFFVGHRLKSS